MKVGENALRELADSLKHCVRVRNKAGCFTNKQKCKCYIIILFSVLNFFFICMLSKCLDLLYFTNSYNICLDMTASDK